MHRRRTLRTLATLTVLTSLLSACTLTRAGGPPLGRESLPERDGWAASGTGTTGGSRADAAHTFTVSTHAELVRALGNGDGTPRLIYVRGTIDGMTAPDGRVLTCTDFQEGGYTLDAYLNAYDPATYGRTQKPAGPLEDARRASAQRQAAQIRLRVGSNTSLIGLDRGARLTHLNLWVEKADNVIIRNLTLEDAADCFPAWDPTDGATGNWNSEYDLISVVTSTHVWVDRVDLSDGRNPDHAQPTLLGRPYQVHDGALDITKGSDLVTVSWSVLRDHDKSMLIGSTDKPAAPDVPTSDRGRLRVTLHHNLFRNLGQRVPRVRFGQVHLYNNLFEITDPATYGYSIGAGVGAQLVVQNNAFGLPAGVTPDRVLYNWSKADLDLPQVRATGNVLTDGPEVDLLAAFNAANPERPLTGNVTWTPTLTVAPPQDARTVPAAVRAGAGPR